MAASSASLPGLAIVCPGLSWPRRQFVCRFSEGESAIPCTQMEHTSLEQGTLKLKMTVSVR